MDFPTVCAPQATTGKPLFADPSEYGKLEWVSKNCLDVNSLLSDHVRVPLSAASRDMH